MNYTKIIKKETKVMFLIVSVLTVLILGVSYAFFMRVDSSANNQVVTTGSLQISYASTNGYINNNTYPDILPMSNTDGLAQTGYSFSVTNTGSLPATYTVYMYVDQAGYTTDNPSGALFTDLNSIRYNIRTNTYSNTNVAALGYQAKKTEDGIDKYELYTGSLNSNGVNTHVVRVWLDKELDVAEIGKYVYLKIEVQGNVSGQQQSSNAKTVTFDANGGTVGITQKTVVPGQTYGDLPTPTREGYTFLGWNGKNMFNKDSEHTGAYVSSEGAIVSSSEVTLFDYLEVIPSQTYTIKAFSTVSAYRYAFYANDKTFISRSDEYTTTASINVPNNAYYIRVFININGGGTAFTQEDIDDLQIQLEQGSTATAYEPYYITSSTEVVQTDNHTLKAVWQANS